jgi:predicted TIM-barrel fold metal-dependent hydrolase
MTKLLFLIFSSLLFIFATTVAAIAQSPASSPPVVRKARFVPAADHHQHIFSPAYSKLTGAKPIPVQEVVRLLDLAGIRRAAILSVAYRFGKPGSEPPDEYAQVKAENDWTSAQIALFPKRLRGLCGFNPLKDYALEELARCSKDPNLRYGIKMHFGNSDVQLENPEHIEKLKRVFREANSRRMAIVVHMRASFSLKRPYGAAQARAFLEQLLPLVPDIPVQIAHFAGSGPGYDDPLAHSVLEVLAEAIEKKDPRTRNLWFDLASNVVPENSPETSALIVRRIRQIGVKRILYGTDAATDSNLKPRESWQAFTRLELSDKELKTIARNVAPYLR